MPTFYKTPSYNKVEADNRFVNTAGDSMNGDLDMNNHDIIDINILSSNEIHSLSSFIHYEDILVSKLSGVDITGNVNITGNVIIGGIISADNLLINNWDSNFTTVNVNSANWGSNYTTVNVNSANWDSSYVSVVNTSANWDSVYTDMSINSSDWTSTYTDVNINSANWEATYTSVNAGSSTWEAASAVGDLRSDVNQVSGDLLYSTVSGATFAFEALDHSTGATIVIYVTKGIITSYA